MKDWLHLFSSLYASARKRVVTPKKKDVPAGCGISFFNTLSRSVEQFTSLQPGVAKMYNCGPTVYGRQHIGNLSMFVFTDILRKTLEYNGYKVKQVINFTDFGHLSSDGDEGEDKMTKGLKREGLALSLENMRALGEKYADIFLEDVRSLNVPVDTITFPRASDFIPAQIAMIHTLQEKGYTYSASGNVYFDTSRFSDYGKLGGINLEGLKSGARVKISEDKKNPTDFLLWKSSKRLGWDSPWGKGFPGWHIECSAMIRATLGAQIDIHTGGIEHIPIHHNNEIAQSESATGKRPLSRFWMHRAHIQLEGSKIAKSAGNVIYMSDIIERGFHPLALRYLFLSSHYRTASNFTWEALGAAQTAFAKLVALRLASAHVSPTANTEWKRKFTVKIDNDLDTPGALSILWEMAHDASLSEDERLSTLLDFDSVLGLNLAEPNDTARKLAEGFMRKEIQAADVPEHVAALIKEREAARSATDWKRADELRDTLAGEGYSLEDSSDGLKILKM